MNLPNKFQMNLNQSVMDYGYHVSMVELRTTDRVSIVYLFNSEKIFLVIMPSFDKRGHFVLHLSVNWYLDQAMSVQYLLTPLLESCQTWCSGCHRE